ncbi:MAG: porin [Longimicrobiaceae bacterium]
MPLRLIGFLWLSALLLPLAAAAQHPGLEIGGRLQPYFATSSVDSMPASAFSLRRARLELEARVDERLSGKFQVEFAGSAPELKDAYVRLDPWPWLGVLAGQAKRPFSRIELSSSSRMPPVERGVQIAGLDALDHYRLIKAQGYAGRGLGVQLLGTFQELPLSPAVRAGLFNGPEGVAEPAARFTLAPLRGLELGAGWSRRAFEGGSEGDAWEADLEYRPANGRFWLAGEVAWGEFDAVAEVAFRGAQGWVSYGFPLAAGPFSRWEPSLRASRGWLESPPAAGGLLLTPGVNLYLEGANRLMLNYDRWLGGDGSEDASSVKVLFQLFF